MCFNPGRLFSCPHVPRGTELTLLGCEYHLLRNHSWDLTIWNLLQFLTMLAWMGVGVVMPLVGVAILVVDVLRPISKTLPVASARPRCQMSCYHLRHPQYRLHQIQACQAAHGSVCPARAAHNHPSATNQRYCALRSSRWLPDLGQFSVGYGRRAYIPSILY
jgi:hypothetical protein